MKSRSKAHPESKQRFSKCQPGGEPRCYLAAMDAFLFDTAVGPCTLRFAERAITGIELPQIAPRELRARLAAQAAERGAPPPFVAKAASAIAQHLAGKPQDLSKLPLALDSLAPFQRQVYQAARAIPSGQTASYGDLAKLLGKPGAARAVGQALGKNPFLLAIPCHRVLAAGGAPGGFSAPGGIATKAQLLALEGVALAGVPAPLNPVDHAPALAHLARKDRKLARLIEEVGPCRLQQARLQSPFEALAESIVYQQLNGRAAATILGRVVALFKPRRFPRPQDLLEAKDELLRAAGLSGGKTRAIKDLAAKTLAGAVPRLAALRQMPEEEIVERLTQVRGIGRWTVEMLMMFRLGRPDVLPATDYGVRKGFALLHGRLELPSPSELLAHGERWRPHRSVASWYLWRATELPASTLARLRSRPRRTQPSIDP